MELTKNLPQMIHVLYKFAAAIVLARSDTMFVLSFETAAAAVRCESGRRLVESLGIVAARDCW
eukprot:3839503-Amphidinium_carterae.1